MFKMTWKFIDKGDDKPTELTLRDGSLIHCLEFVSKFLNSSFDWRKTISICIEETKEKHNDTRT